MNLSISCPNLVEAGMEPPPLAGVSVLTPNLPPNDTEGDDILGFIKRQPAKRWPRGGPRRFSNDQANVPVIVVSSEPKLTEVVGNSKPAEKSCLGKSMEVIKAALACCFGMYFICECGVCRCVRAYVCVWACVCVCGVRVCVWCMCARAH